MIITRASQCATIDVNKYFYFTIIDRHNARVTIDHHTSRDV